MISLVFPFPCCGTRIYFCMNQLLSSGALASFTKLLKTNAKTLAKTGFCVINLSFWYKSKVELEICTIKIKRPKIFATIRRTKSLQIAENFRYNSPKKLETKSAAPRLIDEWQMTFWKIRLQT